MSALAWVLGTVCFLALLAVVAARLRLLKVSLGPAPKPRTDNKPKGDQ